MSKNYLSQDSEIQLINNIIPHLNSKIFVDIGAEKGSFSLVMLEKEMHGFLFEPMLRHHDELEKIVQKYPTTKVYGSAISNVNCKQTFYVATDVEGKELDYFHSLQKADALGVFTHNTSFEVECRSLKSLSKDDELFSEIGILKTDTEGNDLNVLRGLGEIRPEVIICEYFTRGLYEGWTEGAPELIIEYMQGIGYSKFIATKRTDNLEFIGLCTDRYKEKQWGNLIFFRDDMYEKSRHEISECIFNNEDTIQTKFEKLNIELEKKEQVIQQLLAERKKKQADSEMAIGDSSRLATNIRPKKISSGPDMNAGLTALLDYLYHEKSSSRRFAIDIGAHYGEYSKYLANTGHFSKILAFEPNMKSHETITELSSVYDTQRIVPVNLALGRTSGIFDLYCDSDSATASLLPYANGYNNKGDVKTDSVLTTTLDQYLTDHSVDGELALIKIDTQGNDLSVLLGAEHTISKNRPIVQTEFIHIPLYENQCTPCELHDFFSRHNYVLYGFNNIHVTPLGRIAFCDAVFFPKELEFPVAQEFSCLDNQDSLTQQIEILNKICAERLTVINILDAEVKRLKALDSSNS